MIDFESEKDDCIVEEAIEDMVIAIIRLQNLTDRNFVIIQLQDLLDEMLNAKDPI